MKNKSINKFFIFLIYLISLLLVISCTCGLEYYYEDQPIYISIENFTKSISFTRKPMAISKLGKVFLYKNYILIYRKDWGIHVIDNSDAKNPKNIGFIKIPLSDDVSIKENILYASILNDLVTIDISNLDKTKEEGRIKIKSTSISEEYKKGIKIGYKKDVGPFYKTKVCDAPVKIGGTLLSNALTIAITTTPTPSPDPIATNQSRWFSSFLIIGDFLYTKVDKGFNLFSIKNPKEPKNLGSLNMDISFNDNNSTGGIYEYKNKLFITGLKEVNVFDNKNPDKITFITKIDKLTGYNYIVFENNKIYSILPTCCNDGKKDLEVIDIEDISNSKIIKSYPMNNPIGLAIKDNNLFICDGSAGLKIFDAKDSLNLKEIAKVSINNPLDIILNNDYQGIVVSEEGLHQYDFSGLPNKTYFQELSTIKTETSDLFNNNNVVKESDNIYYYKWYKEYFQN